MDIIIDLGKDLILFLFEYLVELVFAVVFVYITTKLIPWIRANYDLWWVRLFVKAAEKIKEAGEDIDKKPYVINCLTRIGIEVDDTVEDMIESVCKELDLLSEKIDETVK